MQQELPDFDTLKEMAEKDPQALEALRQQHVDALIESAPSNTRRRLRGLQFQIDAQRSIHPTPMAACIKLSQMMYESFSELRYLLNEFTEQGPRSIPREEINQSPIAKPAQVLNFQRRQSV